MIFAGTLNDGVFISYNNGANWASLNSGIPTNTQIYSLALNETYVFAGTANKGVWKRPLSEISGINDVDITSSKINIYPNPAIDIITISMNLNVYKDATINIYNLAGVLVKKEILKQKQQQINISDICNGIYIIEVKSEESLDKQKLIIQR
jgi:hypothetical protein